MSIFLKAKWEQLIMANYSVPQEVLLPYLPVGVELDLFEGEAFVSLVGFMFKKTKLFNVPIPLLGSFEEINLRFYVKRMLGNELRRGVVFINETIPFTPVALVANWLYKEHYVTVPTRHEWTMDANKKIIKYEWKKNKHWNKLEVTANTESRKMQPGAHDNFIFEHYFGYTKVNQTDTGEYKINHPSWLVNEITSYEIDCQFDKMYGDDFGFLNQANPHSIYIAEGSDISVDWKRNRI